MVKKLLFKILPIIIMGIAIAVIYIFININNSNYWNQTIKSSYCGKIIQISRKSRGKTDFRINNMQQGILDYIVSIDPNDNRNLFEIASVGDSIIKDSNTAYIKLIKQNGDIIWFEMKNR